MLISIFKIFINLSVISIVWLAGFSNESIAINLHANDANAKGVTAVFIQSNDSAPVKFNAQDERRYIIRFNEPAVARYDGTGQLPPIPRKIGNKIETDSPAVKAYVNHLKQQQSTFLSSLSSELGRPINSILSYYYAINGMAVNLTAEEVDIVKQQPAVTSVRPDQIHTINSDAGPALIGANNIWSGSPPSSGMALGEGIVIAALDTGINFDHPSFADVGDDGFDHTNPLGSGNYVGVCDPSNLDQFIDTYVCNDKLIGGYDFINSLVPDDGSFDIPGPEDENGHGTHTASISAGNAISTAQFNGNNNVGISGVAPHATVIHYDVCYNPVGSDSGGLSSCAGAAVIAAVDQAIAGGLVDVINYSISGGIEPWSDDVSLAFLKAVDSGIFVATSTGDADSEVLNHVEPWTTSAAASTHDRVFKKALSITGPTIEINLVDIAYENTNVPAFSPIIAGIQDAGVVDAANFEGCDTFPANSFDGLVALISAGTCSSEDKVINAASAGAIAVVIYNDVAGSFIIDVGASTTVPSFSISQADGIAMANYIEDHFGSTVLIELPEPVLSGQADQMADFSPRGPSQFEFNKPDISAPGVNILTASNDDAVMPSAAEEYRVVSGTSMSSPFVAGAAALLKELHPTWTTAEIKSAMMLTAKTAQVTKEDGITPADPFDRGSGRIQVDVASSTSLIMDETATGFLMANPAIGGDPKTLNIASYKNDSCIGTCSFQREFTSVAAETITYTVSLAGLSGNVNPNNFTVMPGESIVLNVEIDGDALDPGITTVGELLISPQLPSIDFSMASNLTIVDGGYDTNDPIGNMNCSEITVSGISSPAFTVSLELGIDHAWIGDMTLKLFNPNGDEFALLNRPGFPLDSFGTAASLVSTSPIKFTDSSTEDAEFMGRLLAFDGVVCVADGVCDFFGNPDQELSSVPNFAALSDTDPNGDWLICGGDSVLSDPGNIETATLSIAEQEIPNLHMPLIVTGFPGSPEIEISPSSLTAALDADMSVDLSLNIKNSDAVILPLNWQVDTSSTSNLLDEIYYEQIQTGSFQGIFSDLFIDDENEAGVYSADSFTLDAETDIDGFVFEGFLSPASNLPDDGIGSFTVKVYPDVGGLPAGHPEDGVNAELFSATIEVSDYSLEYIDLGNPQDGISMNVKNATGSSWTLPAGTYWVTVYANVTGPNDWAWFTGVPGDTLLPQIIDPQDVFEDGLTEWTDLITVASGNEDYSGLAFKVRSLRECGESWITYSAVNGNLAAGEDQDVTITLDSTGLAPGLYESAICISSDDSNEPLVAIPVSMNVEGFSDIIFADGFEESL